VIFQYDNGKDFINNTVKEYLKKANTIGGFILFPRHANSINQRRGRKPFDDRFDLALECIRRAFMNESFSSYNPLFNISAEDKDFFKMFGTFQNYAKFFCLDESYGDKHNWVNENGQVTYTITVSNTGNEAATAADNVTLTDTLDPVLSAMNVTYNGAPWSEGTNYTYDETTGNFTAPEGQITVPAAEYVQDPITGAWSVQPGTSTIVITGTVIS
jgi:uncharacterized repeat protein (TIGR01451 family)